MARWEFKLPDIGEGITEGEIVSWLVQPGDVVKDDQPMVEVMTDKATVTITAPKAGTVAETHGKVGEIVLVHAVLVVFELEGGEVAPTALSKPAAANGATKDRPAAMAVGDLKEELPGLGVIGGSAAAATVAQGYFNEKPLATPATRKLARDISIDLRRVPPTGPQGRVTKVDVESFVRLPPAPAASLPPARPGGGFRLGEPRSAVHVPNGPLQERIPFAGLRRKIAQKMAVSTQTAAHFTFVEECDVTELKAMRARLMGVAEGQGIKLSFLPFIVKATVAALKRHPMLNSVLDESTNELVLRKYFHIGIATATDAGLLVPVIKDADRKSILEIARDIDRLAAEARAGQAKLDDLQGSTFTITSPGVQGGLFATPIINFPEVAILGVHRIKRKAIVKNEQIVIGDVMLLSLSFDHRIVDGLVGAAFAYEIIAYLEQPDRLMLEMA
ncbi:MAG TPA: dihydrolipoamide acetyltransferase family protein [Polyangiaceae bacterium]|nr:dihydrolipoamide acetyltransferase family protein [Polyangiaceae bacterium]